jgi:hypothetical protein
MCVNDYMYGWITVGGNQQKKYELVKNYKKNLKFFEKKPAIFSK